MITPAIQVASPGPPAVGQTTVAHGPGVSFHDILSALNPLQYLPVVGTIYRAATGDVIPEALRRFGSLVVSGLMGGPIGLAVNIALTAVEKATDLDPEKIVAAGLNAVLPSTAGRAEIPATDPVSAPPAAGVSASAQLALTPQQLAAYGVRSDPAGTLRLGEIKGADVLNTLELLRIGKAASAYAANQITPLTVATGSG